MFVETPQILWNAEGDKGVNAALMSVSVLQSGMVASPQPTAYSGSGSGQNRNQQQQNQHNQQRHLSGHVLATAGTTPTINLWKVRFPPMAEMTTASTSTSTAPRSTSLSPRYGNGKNGGGGGIGSSQHAKIEYLTSLTRHEMAVKTLAFSPDGLHLATGSDAGGSLIVWSVPLSKRGGNNGRHFWSFLRQEGELTVRIVNHSSSGICDLSWSADSKRFVAGTIDNAVMVCENVNHGSRTDEAQWRTVYNNGMDHTHYVLGASYDPQGVFLATMSSDRSVRVHPRKTPRQLNSKKNKGVLRPAASNGGRGAASIGTGYSSSNAEATAAVCPSILTEAKFEMAKSKQLKYRKTYNEVDGSCTKRHLYADESTLESFVRRLSWTADGAFLVTPAALWHQNSDDGNSNSGPARFATCVFARHNWDEPFRVLLGAEKPSIAVRPNPVLFQLPPQTPVAAVTPPSAGGENLAKENQSPKSSSSAHRLPYRSVFAVLTWDSVLVYDTYHNKPLAVVKGIHYCQLVDATWTSDGHTLIVCSSDGYVSLIRFAPGELGQVYEKPTAAAAATEQGSSAATTGVAAASSEATTGVSSTASAVGSTSTKPLLPLPPQPHDAGAPRLPPCEPGPAAVEAPPAKRSKVAAEADVIGKGVDQLSLHQNVDNKSAALPQHEAPQHVNELQPKKKKKRIQPILMTTN